LQGLPSGAGPTCSIARTTRARADHEALTGPLRRSVPQPDAGSAVRGAGVFVLSDRPAGPSRGMPCSRRS
jgi:hypothetical protein